MNLKITIVLLAVFFISIQAQDISCKNCRCVETHNNTAFKRGEQLAMCVHFVTKDGLSVRTQRVTYVVSVDNYTVVELQEGQNRFALEPYALPNEKVYIVLQPHGSIKSYPIPYVDLNEKRELTFYANVYSAVITIHDGYIQDVIWDNRCVCQESTTCREYDIGTDRKESICNHHEMCAIRQVKCDPKIYISWIGSDKENTKMTSTSMRLARFKDFNIEGAYFSASNLTNITQA